MQIEITEEEFELLCMAVDSAAAVHKRAVDEAPNDEDALLDNEYYLKYRDLQSKFPEPGTSAFDKEPYATIGI